MEKILFIGNIAGKKMTGSFSGAAISAAHSLGFEFHSVANRDKTSQEQMKEDQCKFGIAIHHADICRSPFSLKNITAYRQIVSMINKEGIDYIHCNTPVGGVLGRLAGRKCRVKKVLYQAHGFHFYKGAPIVNWLLYYPIERLLAHYTDALITINHEDYERAQKFHLRNHGPVYYVPGVGINTKDFEPRDFDRERKRHELSFNDDDIVCVSAGDLIERKNYKTAIEAISKARNNRIHYLICGEGPLESELMKYAADLCVDKQIHFLGFRSDIKEILWASDIFLFTTYQEGLSRSLSEAMASGLPCVASRIRGNIDIIDNDEVGFLCDPNDACDFSNAISILANDSELRKRMGLASINRIMKFNTETVEDCLTEVYRNEFIMGGVKIYDFVPSWVRKRLEIGVPIDSILLISVGELNTNKNQSVIIQALEQINDKRIHFILCGEGNTRKEMESMLHNCKNNVHFLGYRSDIIELLRASDIYVMPSHREGLSRSLMEAMCMGLPCICSNIRGNRDLVHHNQGGMLCNSLNEYINAIIEISNNKIIMNRFGKFNLDTMHEFDINVVIKELIRIYSFIFN